MKAALKVLWLSLGVSLLVLLCYRVGTIDFRSIARPETLLILLTAPPWIFMSASAMGVLLPKRFSVFELAKIDVIAESIGTLIPSSGLAGEPWRLMQLASRGGGVGPATTSLLSYRLVHAFSGLLDIVATASISLATTQWSDSWRSSFTAAASAAGCIASGILLTYLLWPAARRRFCPPRQLAMALLAKLVGRVLLLSEVWLIFWMLGVHANLSQGISVAAIIIASSSFLPMFPGGIGVTEMGITMVFEQLGLPASMGLTFGIIRQAGNLTWMGIGSVLLLSWKAHHPEDDGLSEADRPGISFRNEPAGDP